ncbi:MAG TPA: hypothetical protein VK742_10105 [Candidatus Sulfotelmatobacter sp.]|jgi:hypothetical protein|nr:hypothetical protein [Candidatus Sulfotelmatobacter sp.]
MLKIIRYVLYGLAILSGVAGLMVGGLPLAQFARERLQAEDSARDYYDTTYLHAPEIIFLLSLILLVGVCIGLTLEKGISPANPPRSEKPAELQRTEAAAISAAGEIPAPQTSESADEKLSRLLNREKE